ncbi:ABC transporter permease [Chloroflexota bacterium]
MKIIEIFKIASRSLTANKLRSTLTMLGIIIGVGAVITLMSVGQGLEASITSVFEDLGTNQLYVQSINPDAPAAAQMAPGYAVPNLTLDDAEALADIPSALRVTVTNENFVELIAGSESTASVIHGSDPQYLPLYKYTIAEGQFISDRNITSRDMVVVLGSGIVDDLYGEDNPVGQKIKISGKRFTVIGTFEPRGSAMFGFSLDDVVVVPITTYQTRLFTLQTTSGIDAIQAIVVNVASAEDMDDVTEDIETVLRKRHKIDDDDKDDFAIMSQEQVLGMFTQITTIFTVFMGAVASISLLVGGIGIMNIMLISVTERTREIGIRKAVGAKRRDIQFQFLVEAAMLSLSGGAIGIIGGLLLAYGISLIELEGFSLEAVVSPGIIILAVSVSVFIGLVSGLYPAQRAARLNPIDALHYG